MYLCIPDTGLALHTPPLHYRSSFGFRGRVARGAAKWCDRARAHHPRLGVSGGETRNGKIGRGGSKRTKTLCGEFDSGHSLCGREVCDWSEEAEGADGVRKVSYILVNLYSCLYIHIHIYMYICISIYICLDIYIYMYIYIYLCVCMYIRICVYIYKYVRVWV